MKGIILAGGSGTRLYPMTKAISKQLIPIYDKPMIYYPLSTLMLAGLREVLVISTPEDTPKFELLLGDGSQFGMSFSYKIQEVPNGLAQAFILGEEFLNGDSACLVLGDNIFYGNGFTKLLRKAKSKETGATIFGQYVRDPERYGVIEFDSEGKVLSLEEKPEHPKSNYAAVGLYFYDRKVTEYAKQIKPSPRGEYEITDLNRIYLQRGELDCELFGRGFAWLDTGTTKSLNDASNYVRTVEEILGIKISIPEEIAYKNGWIGREELLKAAAEYNKTSYGEHLLRVAKNEYYSKVEG